MNFELSEEHLAVKEAARDFAQNVLKSGVIERDNKQEFPTAQIKELGELGGQLGRINDMPRPRECLLQNASCCVAQSLQGKQACVPSINSMQTRCE